MLHILWILLKFILILLGILLGLILLTVLLLLFCPVRYQATASKETDSVRDISARVRISWLLGGVSFRLQYARGTSTPEFRLFGIPVMKIIRKLRSRRTSEPYTKTKSAKEDIASASYNEPAEKSSSEPHHEPEENNVSESYIDLEEDSYQESHDEAAEEENLEYVRSKLGTLFYKIGSLCRSIQNKFHALWAKICRIPSSVENFALTIQNFCDKIESFKRFLDHPRTRAAFSLVKDRLFKLLRHVFPTRIQGTLIFGSTDPSVTGAALAILGMTIPFHKNCISVTPLFEDRNILQGNVQLRGRVYGIVLLKTAVELYFNKNIKFVIRRWKHKED